MVCATALYITKRTIPLFERLVEARSGAPQERPPEIPADLILAANNEAAGWAREDALKTMQELYLELGDWNKVRTVYMARTAE